MPKLAIRQWLIIFSAVATIAINLIAEILPLNGKTTAAISDSYPVYFVPAGYVFVIWGVIYIGMLAYAYFRAQVQNANNSTFRKLDPWFILGCIANSAWIIAWHYEQIHLSVLIILTLLASLIAMYLILHRANLAADRKWKWLIYIPTSIYLAWVSVASIANINMALYAESWTGLGLGFFYQTWAAIFIMAVALLTCFLLITKHDVAFALVAVWALVGIYVKFPAEPAVTYAAVLAVTMILALLVMNLLHWWRLKSLSSE